MSTEKFSTSCVVKPFNQRLECKLSNAELRNLKVEIVDTEMAIEQLRQHHQAAVKRFQEALCNYTEAAEAWRAAVRSGSTYRDVACMQVIDYGNKTLTVTRRDTGEVLSTRALTTEELEAKPE